MAWLGCGGRGGSLIILSLQRENAQYCRPALADKSTSEPTKARVVANIYTVLNLPGIILSALHLLTHFILRSTLGGKDYYYSHCIDEETEAGKVE